MDAVLGEAMVVGHAPGVVCGELWGLAVHPFRSFVHARTPTHTHAHTHTHTHIYININVNIYIYTALGSDGQGPSTRAAMRFTPATVT